MAMYAVNGEILTGIADAIRTKTDSDEPMEVSTFASAIENIPSGGSGGLPDGITGIATGTFSFPIDTVLFSNPVTVAHGLQGKPKFAFFYDETAIQTNGFYRYLESSANQVFSGWGVPSVGDGVTAGGSYSVSNTSTIAAQNYIGNNVGKYSGILIDDINLKISAYSGHTCPAGHVYRWVAIA